jgi:glycosyltransferase involved in cell wall biosynthesis
LKPEVSLCIPAWQAEAFINETLASGTNQTYPNLRILISVDQSSDRTAEVCAQVAARDPRIQIFVQHKRLGWAGNVNFLLAQVKTPLFFFLWHDDLIAPQFIDTLATALIGHPHAMSAYGSTRHFGGHNSLTVGQSFMGSVAERLIEVLTSPALHGLSRCMMRSEILSMGLCIPQLDGRDYYENNTGYFIKILASGPVLHVAEAEYQRRNGSGLSVVDGWLKLSQDKALEGFRQNVRVCMQIFRDCLHSPEEMEAVTYCLFLFLTTRLRHFERGVPGGTPIQPSEIASDFDGLQAKDPLHLFNEGQRQLVANAKARLFN